MDSLLDFGTGATTWLQENYPQLEAFLKLVSQFGLAEFYLAVIPLIYWCIEKRLGRNLSYLVTFASLLNGMIKHIFRDPRPYWHNPAVGLSEEVSYGFVSGHTQGATVAYLTLALWIRKRWMWLLAGLIILLMSLSRVYLGVHDIPDVIGGFLLGLLVVVGYLFWGRYLEERYAKRILGQRLLLALIIPFLLGLIYLGAMLLVGRPDEGVAWASFIDPAEQKSIEEFTRNFSALIGLTIGFIFEASRIRFLVAGPAWKRAARFLLGISVTFVLWAGLGEIFPRDPLEIAIPLRAVRYFLASLWVSYYAPLAFVRLRLAEAAPDPGIDLSI
jgi:membrane-associated phospholipid phosphatase